MTPRRHAARGFTLMEVLISLVLLSLLMLMLTGWISTTLGYGLEVDGFWWAVAGWAGRYCAAGWRGGWNPAPSR